MYLECLGQSVNLMSYTGRVACHHLVVGPAVAGLGASANQ